LRRKEHSAQIDVEYGVPVLRGDLQRWLAHVQASVAHHDVERPETVDRLLDRGADGFGLAHVEPHSHCAWQLACQSVHVVSTRGKIGEGYCGTLLGKGRGYGLAETASSPSDEGDPGRELLCGHASILSTAAPRICP
jgi:hypothetical protein